MSHLPVGLHTYGGQTGRSNCRLKASRAWEHFKEAKWRRAAEKGLAPITVGLLLASGLVITRAADHGWSAIMLTAATTILLVVTRVNPLLIMAGAGLLGGFGLVQ